MDFEFVPHKGALNRAKHGIDFEDAQVLWFDPYLLTAPAGSEDEQPFLAIGKIGEKHWSAIYVMREHRIRLTSVRRCREQETSHHESA